MASQGDMSKISKPESKVSYLDWYSLVSKFSSQLFKFIYRTIPREKKNKPVTVCRSSISLITLMNDIVKEIENKSF